MYNMIHDEKPYLKLIKHRITWVPIQASTGLFNTDRWSWTLQKQLSFLKYVLTMRTLTYMTAAPEECGVPNMKTDG